MITTYLVISIIRFISFKYITRLGHMYSMEKIMIGRLHEVFREYTNYIQKFVNQTYIVKRDLDSRLDDLMSLRREVEPTNVVFKGKNLIEAIDQIDKNVYPIIGVDGSSRVIDTAYLFIGISTLSIYSRILGEILDHPPLPLKYILPSLKEPFIALSFDVEDEEIINKIFDQYNMITFKSPAGVIYRRDYNKTVILDELRTSLENKALIHVGENIDVFRKTGLDEFNLFIDGPVYPVPNVFKQYYNLLYSRRPPRGRIDDYIASWQVLIKDRLRGIKLLEKNNIPVIGIVKRIESSRILINASNFNDLLIEHNIHIGDLGNDQAYIDIILRTLIMKKAITMPYKPMIIGPIYVPACASYIDKFIEDLPDKIMYYIVLPLHRYSGQLLRYILYRVEMTTKTMELLTDLGIEPYMPALADSIGMGTALPFTILYTDKRSKLLSRSLAQIIAGDLEARGIPLTYDTIRTIEAYIHD